MLVAFTSAREPQAMVKILVGIVVIALLGLAGFTYLTLHWAYSEGERAGYVQKLSRRGFICKTWEGEMAMVTMPGTVAEKFLFTVPSEAVAAKVNAAVGKRMALHYQQHKWVPSSCFGDTEYFVTDVRVTE
jgi:restriction endonuclease Mrr